MITVLRHPRPLQPGLCAGHFEMPVEDPTPRVQTLATELRAHSLARIHSSPASRCKVLAVLLAEALGLPLHIDERLVELDFGEWEGRTWDDITNHDQERFESWSHNWQRASPPGGECVTDLERRVAAFVDALPQEAVLLVTHAGPIRAMKVLLESLDWQAAMSEPIPYLVPMVTQRGVPGA
jgi:alpha-ribazole phosphatase